MSSKLSVATGRTNEPKTGQNGAWMLRRSSAGSRGERNRRVDNSARSAFRSTYRHATRECPSSCMGKLLKALSSSLLNGRVPTDEDTNGGLGCIFCGHTAAKRNAKKSDKKRRRPMRSIDGERKGPLSSAKVVHFLCSCSPAETGPAEGSCSVRVISKSPTEPVLSTHVPTNRFSDTLWPVLMKK